MTDDLDFFGSRARIHASSSETGDFALIEVLAPPGRQPPLHVHREDGESWYVLEGELTVWIGERVHAISPGEFRLAPPKVPHTLRAGPDGARYLLIVGGRFEAFVRAVAALGEPDPERLTAVAAEHGIDILGPPGMLPAELAA
jgi:quercetin dioxygenase-like cupin family protein